MADKTGIPIQYQDVNGAALQGDFKADPAIQQAIENISPQLKKAGVSHLIIRDGTGFGNAGKDIVALDPAEVSSLTPTQLKAATTAMLDLSQHLNINNEEPYFIQNDDTVAIRISGNAITGATKVFVNTR